MTTLCGGGTSSSKPGFGSTLVFTTASIAALLNNIPTAWAVPLAGYIGLISYDLSNFCSTDPPAVPTITAADVIALLNPFNPLSYDAAQSKFQDLVGAYAWHLACQCDSVATPAPPTPPADPGVSVNPSQPPITNASGCYDVSSTFVESTTPTAAGGGSTHTYNWTPQVLTQPGPLVTVISGQPQLRAYLIPSGATHWAWTETTNSGGPGSTNHVDGVFSFVTSSGAFISGGSGEVTINANGVSSSNGPFAIPATAAAVVIWGHDVSHSSSINMTLRWQFYCGSTAPVTQQPCCPPDTTLQGVLDNILGMVTLIQRQQVPFAYLGSTTHSGLSGSGHIAVQGLIGARVLVTEAAYGAGGESGDPSELDDFGWINWGNADGSSSRLWISNSPFVSLPSSAGQYTRIGYSIRAGGQISITELVREP